MKLLIVVMCLAAGFWANEANVKHELLASAPYTPHGETKARQCLYCFKVSVQLFKSQSGGEAEQKGPITIDNNLQPEMGILINKPCLVKKAVKFPSPASDKSIKASDLDLSQIESSFEQILSLYSKDKEKKNLIKDFLTETRPEGINAALKPLIEGYFKLDTKINGFKRPVFYNSNTKEFVSADARRINPLGWYDMGTITQQSISDKNQKYKHNFELYMGKLSRDISFRDTGVTGVCEDNTKFFKDPENIFYISNPERRVRREL